MKKFLTVLLGVILAVCTFSLIACDKDKGNSGEVTVVRKSGDTYILNVYQTEYDSENNAVTDVTVGKTDGFTWFVKDAVIGDVVEARVMKTKKSYGFARLMQV